MAISKEDYFNLKEYWDYQRLLQYNRELLKQRLAKMQGSVFTQLGPMNTSELYDKIWVDINSKKDRSVLIKSIEQKWNNFILRCNYNQFDVINISTDKDYVDPLMNYFRKRDKSY